MGATKKSAKRSPAKKRAAVKGSAARRTSAKKQPARKTSSKRRSKKSGTPTASGLKRQARKGLKAARGSLDSVLQAGEKTWETLKNTTANVVEGVVEGVKETFAGDQRPPSRRSNSR